MLLVLADTAIAVAGNRGGTDTLEVAVEGEFSAAAGRLAIDAGVELHGANG